MAQAKRCGAVRLCGNLAPRGGNRPACPPGRGLSRRLGRGHLPTMLGLCGKVLGIVEGTIWNRHDGCLGEVRSGCWRARRGRRSAPLGRSHDPRGCTRRVRRMRGWGSTAARARPWGHPQHSNHCPRCCGHDQRRESTGHRPTSSCRFCSVLRRATCVLDLHSHWADTWRVLGLPLRDPDRFVRGWGDSHRLGSPPGCVRPSHIRCASL